MLIVSIGQARAVNPSNALATVPSGAVFREKCSTGTFELSTYSTPFCQSQSILLSHHRSCMQLFRKPIHSIPDVIWESLLVVVEIIDPISIFINCYSHQKRVTQTQQLFDFQFYICWALLIEHQSCPQTHLQSLGILTHVFLVLYGFGQLLKVQEGEHFKRQNWCTGFFPIRREFSSQPSIPTKSSHISPSSGMVNKPVLVVRVSGLCNVIVDVKPVVQVPTLPIPIKRV